MGLSAEGEYIDSGYTDADGNAVVHFELPLQSEKLLLTVTAFNAKPYRATITVSGAKLACYPGLYAKSLYQERSLSQQLGISNIGDPSSTLYYAVRMLPDYSDTEYPAKKTYDQIRDISGSTVTLSETEYNPGETKDLMVNLVNNSPDDEWIAEVQMKFPETITLNHATKLNEKDQDWGLTPDMATGAGALVTWKCEDIDNDSIVLEASGTVNLSFSPSASGPLEIAWTMNGDFYSDTPPHFETGVITLAQATPNLKMISPNGAESWLIGSAQEIVWTSANYTGTVDIDYSVDGGASWQAVDKGLENSGSYFWDIDTAKQSDNCRVRVSATEGSVSATSAAAFSLYYPLDWVTLSKDSGVITGKGTEYVTLKFNAAGKDPGTYNAILEVTSIVGTSVIPVQMTVLADSDKRNFLNGDASCFISTVTSVIKGCQ